MLESTQKTRTNRAATTIQTTINPHPHQPQWGNVLNTNLVVVIAPGKRPASIPNLEAKPGSANGTATDRLWESRTPPQHTYRSGQRPFVSGRFFLFALCRRSRSTPFEPCRHEACGIDDEQLFAIRLSVCPADEKPHVTDQRRPRSVLLHAMLYPWSLLHISTDLTTTVVKMRFSPNVWRRMTASPINLR